MDQNNNQQEVSQPSIPVSPSPSPAGEPAKKSSNPMLMIFILVGMLIIFVFLIYALVMNQNITQIQEQESIVSPPLEALESVSPSPVTGESGEDAEINNIESDLGDLDSDLQGL